ncbi:MAG: helix-turn-helix domain-containing protein [Microbacteriaceae bacterium]
MTLNTATQMLNLSNNPKGLELDALTLGRRIRAMRRLKKMTLEELAQKLDKAQSYLSMVENGKREPKVSQLHEIAQALGCTVEELLSAEGDDRRTVMEIELQKVQHHPVFQGLGLPNLKIGPALSDDAVETIYGLYQEIERLRNERLATPEEARRANAELRTLMRSRNNYFEELEAQAAELLRAVGHSGGPVTQRTTSDIAGYLGFDLHYVNDLPSSTRSVTDLRNGRIYLPQRVKSFSDPRTELLHAFASHLLSHSEPNNYADFLLQKVESNYLAAAILMPEADVLEKLHEAKAAKQISIEDLRDMFAVSYETAAHRFTNLATQHLDIPVHFMKVNMDGTITKAYENDNVGFPSDNMGAIEGQRVCRHWTARVVFDIPDRFNPYAQYTDTPTGTYWCTSRVQSTATGEYSVSIGVPFNQVGYFRGREVTNRSKSTCPDENCCRRAPQELETRWATSFWPTTRTPSSLLTSLPVGNFPGVDRTEVFEFLERHGTLA